MNFTQKKITAYIDNHKPEVVLLLKCCQHFVYQNALTDIKQVLVNEKINWGTLLATSKQHGILLPVIHILTLHRQSLSIPPVIIKKFLNIQQQLISRNKRLAQELVRVEQAFAQKNIKAIPYKGLSLASQFYHNIFQRTSVDIDFALDINEFHKATEIMTQLGYEELKGSLNENAIEKSRAYYIDYPWVMKKGDKVLFNVEFHWTPSHHILNIPIQFADFADATTPVKMGKMQTISFSKVHQALFAVIHHGNVDCWGKLKHLLDFALIIKELDKSETHQLEALCKKYKIYTSYEIGKSFLAQFFQLDTSYNSSPSQRWTQEILEGKLKGNWSENKYKFIVFINSRDSWFQKIKAAFSIIKYQFFIKPRLND